MRDLILGRRDLIRLSVLGSVLGLSGCSLNTNKFVLGSHKGVLPGQLLKSLPSNWKFKLLETSPGINPYKFLAKKRVDCLALSDGWLPSLSFEDFYPIEFDKSRARLNRQSTLFLSSFDPSLSSKLLPFAFTPWVMLFRRGNKWLPKAREKWDVLLEPELQGDLVLPNSARIVISLADRIGSENELKRLRKQVKTFDSQNAMNWVLSGRAKVAVLPLQYCMKALSKDPRLSVALPAQGAPLHWTILMRPKGSRQLIPYSWINESWQLPLISKLIARGWIPPLPYVEIMDAIKYVPKEYRSFLFSSQTVLENCWSLAPLDEEKVEILEKRWNNSAP